MLKTVLFIVCAHIVLTKSFKQDHSLECDPDDPNDCKFGGNCTRVRWPFKPSLSNVHICTCPVVSCHSDGFVPICAGTGELRK